VPKEVECRETLDTIIEEYNIPLRPDEKSLYMTQQAIAVFITTSRQRNSRYSERG
jgi:hypothetical protein